MNQRKKGMKKKKRKKERINVKESFEERNKDPIWTEGNKLRYIHTYIYIYIYIYI